MTQTLYSLRTDSDQFRITKFVDGEVESSYLSTETECECPAGHRPSCRHRQMLPMMLAHGIVNTHWFWNFDTNRVVDFSGELKSNIDALNELAAEKCPGCGSKGFAKSILGPDRCEYCDGTFGGNPPDPSEVVGEAQHVEVRHIPDEAIEIIHPQPRTMIRTGLPPASWRRL